MKKGEFYLKFKRTFLITTLIVVTSPLYTSICNASSGSFTWYLSEGSTNGFDTFILIQNPNNSNANVKLTYMDNNGNTKEETITLSAHSRFTRKINDITEMNNKGGVSTKVESLNSVGIIAERSMYWNAGGIEWAGGHCSTGVTNTSTKWYLAEGATLGTFDEWVLIQNPNSNSAICEVTFMKSDGSTVVQNVTVPTTTRYTIKVNDYVPNESVSTTVKSTNGVGIVVERAMYWDAGGTEWAGGHCSAGITSPTTRWYLAEGCTNGFDTYILIQNPNDNDADVKLTYMDNDGNTKEEETTVSSHSRFTRKINDISEMNNKGGVSTKVESTNGIGIIAERAMYWDAGGIEWAGGHCSAGVTSTSTKWFLAEGATLGSFDEWVLIQNPDSSPATCQITFMKSDGSTVVQNVTVGATSRYTIKVNDYVPNESVSTEVESTNGVGIVVERAMYWDSGGIEWKEGHCSTGVKQSNTVVLCMGDSVTNGYPYGATSNTYPAKLFTLLESTYGNGAYTVYNHGVNGYRADEVLADLQNHNWLSLDPDYVLLMVGGNDLAQEILPDLSNLNTVLNQTVTEVQSIIDLINTHTNASGSHPKIIVSTFIPNNIAGVGGTTVVALYNTRLKNNLTGMDLLITTNWDDFYNGSGEAKESLMSDTIHPNTDGYSIMAQNWLEAIGSLIGSSGGVVKNIILFIGDGMGFEHVKAGRIFSVGPNGFLNMEALYNSGEVTTNSLSGVTDSAAAATAIATGYKVYNGYVSRNENGTEYKTILEYAKSLGKRTGLVTTTEITHATPAPFGAHTENRNNWDEIANNYIYISQPNILFGGGKKYWLSSNEPGSMRSDNGLIDDAQIQGYTYVDTASELTSLNMDIKNKVLGLFSLSHMTYKDEKEIDSTEPDLPIMTAKALDLLEEDPDGFFLMVEGGRIDHASHNNNITNVVHETKEFDKAVEIVLNWITSHPDTLIIIAADHETGGLQVIDGNYSAGQIPDVTWSTTEHTETNVPIWGKGPCSKNISEILANTDIFNIMLNAICNGSLPPDSTSPPEDWPGDSGTLIAQTSNLGSGYEPSGAVWNSSLNKLIIVGDDGDVTLMDANGNNVTTWHPCNDDLEGVTIVNPSSNYVYIGNEQPDTIKEFNLSTGQLTGKSWDLTPWMTGPSNSGLEALTFVPNGKHPYPNSDSGGLFYAGLEHDGRIYIFDVDLSSSGNVSHIDTLTPMPGYNGISGLCFANNIIYAIYRNNKILIEMKTDGTLISKYNLPGDAQEGVAVVTPYPYTTASVFITEDTGPQVWRYDNYPVQK